MNIIISFILLIVLLMLGIPVAFTFFAAALYLIATGDYSITFVVPFAFSKLSSLIIMATPMYVMAGGIIEKGDLGNHLVNFIELFFGRFKGGLGVVAVLACALFGAISGSATATETVIGSIMWPRLDKAGYDKGITASLISSSCLLGSYIPPSAMMIIFAWLCDLSVLGCFLAVLGPGLILMVMFSLWIFFKCRKDPNVKVIKFEKTPTAKKERRKTVLWAVPALFFPIIILGGIYGGIFTPTEAAAVATLYAIPVTIFIYHGMTVKQLMKTFAETATMSGVIMLMLFSVMMLARIYTTENLPALMLAFTQSVTNNKYLVLLFINVIYIILGMLMDDTSAMTLASPILLPVAVGMGIDPYHFAAITAVNLGLGCVTPPCAPLLYLGAKLSNTPVTKMMRSTGSIIVWIWIPIIAIVTLFPQVATFLPSLIGR